MSCFAFGMKDVERASNPQTLKELKGFLAALRVFYFSSKKATVSPRFFFEFLLCMLEI